MGRIIVVHSSKPMIGEDNPTAHCFGPFDSYEDALAFDKVVPDDCYKWALDLVGPEDQDVDAQPTHGPHHDRWHGSRPQ